MKVRVRLHGTLSASGLVGEQSEGTELEVPEGTTVASLLRLLGIHQKGGAAVVMAGRVVGPDDPLQPGAAVEVFRVIAGG